MVNGADGTVDDSRNCTCKIGAGIQEYALEEMNGDLRNRWTGRGEKKQSVRKLADYFNREVLAAAMNRRGVTSLEGEVENVYRLLTDEDVSSGVRTQARKQLEREGVDVERLLNSFVSHQTVYRHLRRCLEVAAETSTVSDATRIAKSKQKIQSLQNRFGKVTEDTLAQLQSTGRIELDAFEVFTEISVVCRDCGSQYAVEELLNERGCECQKDD